MSERQSRLRYVRTAADAAHAELQLRAQLAWVRSEVHAEMDAERPRDYVTHDGMIVAKALVDAIATQRKAQRVLNDTDSN